MSGSQNFFWEADPVGPARIFLFLLEVDSIDPPLAGGQLRAGIRHGPKLVAKNKKAKGRIHLDGGISKGVSTGCFLN